MRMMGRIAYPAVLVSGLLSLTACASISHIQIQEGEAPLVQGPPARDNVTPLTSAYACMADRMTDTGPIGIAVGNVKDYTGQFSEVEGNAITQGGALMVISALGKLGSGVRVHERFDTQVSEIELAYMDKRRLGDGESHEVEGQTVPWMPYYGGTILKSDYYIVGGITELNYNIQSGGAEFAINQVGPKARTYTMNIAADLRIVNTKTLVVVKTVSLQKQIVGYEVGAGIFRFFNTNLVDLNTGAKNQEPLQLGVRTVLELGVLELIAAVRDLDHRRCLYDDSGLMVEKGPVYSRSAAVNQQADEITSAPAAAEAKKSPAARLDGPTHTVLAGETVSGISQRYGVSQQVIVEANGLASPEDVMAGQQLTIPGGKLAAAEAEQSAPPQPAAQAGEAAPSLSRMLMDPEPAPPQEEAEMPAHTTSSGETEGRPRVAAMESLY